MLCISMLYAHLLLSSRPPLLYFSEMLQLLQNYASSAFPKIVHGAGALLAWLKHVTPIQTGVCVCEVWICCNIFLDWSALISPTTQIFDSVMSFNSQKPSLESVLWKSGCMAEVKVMLNNSKTLSTTREGY